MSETEEQESASPKPRQAESHPGCYCMGAGPTLSKLVAWFEPPGEAGEHFRQARIEMLRGIRALIDHRIETLSRTGTKGTRVTVE